MAAIALLTDTVAALDAVDGLNADLDLTDVRVPGAWVRLRTIEHGGLAMDSDELGIEVVLITTSSTPARVYKKLLALFDQVKGVLGVPDDVARLVTVNHPEGGSLPGLAIPYQLVP